jgi:hypothetical protein
MRPRLYRAVGGRISRALTFLAMALSVSAQQSAILTNSGILTNNDEPMRLAYSCAEEDLQWAGMSCSDDEPCPIYLELNSVVPDGRKIFAAGDLHSNAATISSVLLMSDDSGATWREPAARMRGTALDQMQFYNPEAGWAAGETQYPLPRDPFFLITTNGGGSWRQQLVGEEDSSGAIQRFWFDSERHGELIIDAGKGSEGGRYHSYESETGGENWTLRGKSDQLPKLRRAPPAGDDADWRTRPSKDGKAIQIEERTGGQWKSVASFLIEAANCRPQAGELKEPPAPEENRAPEPPAPATPKQRQRR